MQVGREEQEKQAIMIMETDSTIKQEVLEELNKVEDIGLKEIRYVEI